jgi:hypothetical protein
MDHVWKVVWADATIPTTGLNLARESPMPRYADDARWQAVIADFRLSGLTQPEFCRIRGLPLHTFRRRLYARRGADPAAANPTSAATPPPDVPRFVPVTIVADPPSQSAAPAAADSLVLILDGQFRIAVPPDFDAETLHRLLDALEIRR